MPLPRVRLLDFDGSVARQPDFLSQVEATTVDLTALGPAARLWPDRAQAAAIRRALDPEQRAAITFLGSGDYHYVSALLLEQFTEPVTLVVFDHHPDWDRLPPRYGCGAWVSRALGQKNVSQVVLVGNASADLSFPAVVTGSLGALRDRRLLQLPAAAPRRQVWPWSGLPWRELGADPVRTLAGVIAGLACRRVYVSIDKDCLTAPFALTNWEEGSLTLELLLSLLQTLRRECEIVGLDVTGEYSPAACSGRWKSWCSAFDHPRDFSARGRSPAEIARINGATNRRIVERLTA
jgi:arginase family enzyme